MTTFRSSAQPHQASVNQADTEPGATHGLLAAIIQEQLVTLESLTAEGRAQIEVLQHEVADLAVRLQHAQANLGALSALLLAHERVLNTLRSSIAAAPAPAPQEEGRFIQRNEAAPVAAAAQEQTQRKNPEEGTASALANAGATTQANSPQMPPPVAPVASATPPTPALPATPAAEQPAAAPRAEPVPAPSASPAVRSPAEQQRTPAPAAPVNPAPARSPAPPERTTPPVGQSHAGATTDANPGAAGSVPKVPQPAQPAPPPLRQPTAEQPHQNGGGRVVQRGSRVEIVFDDEPDDMAETYTIVHSRDAKPTQRLIGENSPLGSALLGARPGDVRRFQVRGGPEQTVRVRSVT